MRDLCVCLLSWWKRAKWQLRYVKGQLCVCALNLWLRARVLSWQGRVWVLRWMRVCVLS